MKKQIAVKFNKVEDYWAASDFMRIQQGMRQSPFKNFTKTVFENVVKVGCGYAFMTKKQIEEIKNDFLLVDAEGKFY